MKNQIKIPAGDMNLLRIPQEKIGHYLETLNKRLTNLSEILTKENDEFVAPYLKIVKETVDCLVLKHGLENQDRINFSLTIDPTDSGFPTFKDFYLLEKDKENAEQVLEKLSKKEEIIESIRDKLLKGRSPVTEQMQLKKYNFYSKLKDTNLLKEFHLSEPKFIENDGKKRFYTLEWSCIERGSNIPVFYRMYFSQDARFPILHQNPNHKLRTIIYESQYGRRTLRDVVSVIDNEIDEIHPRLINKYVIGPYFNDLTINHPELNSVFKGVNEASILKFSIEAVASISTKKFGSKLRQLLGYAIEKEIYGPLDNSDRRIIAPFNIKQKLGKVDEYGNKCRIYGVTDIGIA